jgi:hypothetical protein
MICMMFKFKLLIIIIVFDQETARLAKPWEIAVLREKKKISGSVSSSIGAPFF